jgi:hypothetical protein
MQREGKTGIKRKENLNEFKRFAPILHMNTTMTQIKEKRGIIGIEWKISVPGLR